MIKKLMDELTVLVEDYTRDFKPTDAAEWNVVLSEISTFLEAEKKLTPVDLKGKVALLTIGNLLAASSRVQIERTTKFDKDGVQKMKLQEAILVGNYQNQIKFSELTLDMYRMLQSLEREPTGHGKEAEPAKVEEKQQADGAPSTEVLNNSDEKNATRRNNPHKYLLYKPTFAQLMLYIATAFKVSFSNSRISETTLLSCCTFLQMALSEQRKVEMQLKLDTPVESQQPSTFLAKPSQMAQQRQRELQTRLLLSKSLQEKLQV